MWNNAINVIGLILDVIGVIGLFRYGLPARHNKDGAIYKAYSNAEAEAKELKAYLKLKRKSHISLIIVIVGFSMQILSVFNIFPDVPTSETYNEATNDCDRYYCCCCCYHN